MLRRSLSTAVMVLCLLFARQAVFAQDGDLKERTAEAPPDSLQIPAGTHVLLRMVNAVSTRQAQVGDRLYLETAYPVFESGRLLVPQGSWVMGTVTAVKRPARIKGGGELQVHFDSLTLPNGVSRSFHSDVGAIDQDGSNKLDREKGTIQSKSDKGAATATTIGSTAGGAALGTAIGAAAGHAAEGAALGAAGGLASGLVGVLLSRRPDAMLARGSTVEMVLDRPLVYAPADIPAK